MEIFPTASVSKASVKGARPVPTPKSAVSAMSKKPVVRKAKKPVVKPTPAEIRNMIAVTAYYIAAERGFSPGSEMDDWLQAEKQVLAPYS